MESMDVDEPQRLLNHVDEGKDCGEESEMEQFTIDEKFDVPPFCSKEVYLFLRYSLVVLIAMTVVGLPLENGGRKPSYIRFIPDPFKTMMVMG
jgi:hypothetical protein